MKKLRERLRAVWDKFLNWLFTEGTEDDESGIEEIDIVLNCLMGPILLSDYSTGEVYTGIDVIDNDPIVRELNTKCGRMYSQYYYFYPDYSDEPFFFDHVAQCKEADVMIELLGKLLDRLDEINDGSYVVNDRNILKRYPLLSEQVFLEQEISGVKKWERFMNNDTFYDQRFYGSGEVILSLKDHPEYNLHIWEGYMGDILQDPKREGDYWSGFTRDFHELVRTFSSALVEIENLDEYINDLLLYKDVQFEFDETFEAYELILDFLAFAKENNLTVLARFS